MKKVKAFCSWSGGKDCTLSLWKAISSGFDVTCMLNMVSADAQHSRSHGIKAECLKKQSQALGIPLIQQTATKECYEAEYKKAIISFKKQGIEAGVFGDIDFMPHLEWVKRICRECGIQPYLPLWERKREELLDEFLKAGFETVVVAVNLKFLGKEWLGRKIDKKFIEDLKKIKGVDLSGEAGEYHTFVINGPLFKKRIEISSSDESLKDNRWLLNVDVM